MSELIELIAKSGVERLLESLSASSESALLRKFLEGDLANLGSQTPASTVDELISAEILDQVGMRFGLSRKGRKIALLLEAMNGGDLETLVTRLRRIDGSQERYEIVKQGMTTRFLDTFVERPHFGALYVCSPWINLNEREASLIRYGVIQSEKRNGRRPDIHVITRPWNEIPKEIRAAPVGMKPLVEMGANVYYLKNVHTKLYIREPDESGGYSLALVGSENLTQSNYLELGIQINGDGRLIAQLIAHFLDLTSYSSEKP